MSGRRPIMALMLLKGQLFVGVRKDGDEGNYQMIKMPLFIKEFYS